MCIVGECKGLFDRSLIPVRRLLDDLNMSPENIDEVVLVGGTTRIPLIKTLLKYVPFAMLYRLYVVQGVLQ